MALDPRYISSGIQMGRQLAPKGPPIQETMMLDMQRNQSIMEIMQTLLKAHAGDVADLRKMQLSTWADLKKAAANLPPSAKTQASALNAAADEALRMDMSRFSMFNQPGGTDTSKVGLKPEEKGRNAMSMLTPFMKGAGNVAQAGAQTMGNAAQAGMQAVAPAARFMGRSAQEHPILNSMGPIGMGIAAAKTAMKPKATTPVNPYAKWYPNAFYEDGVWKVMQGGKKYRIQE